MTGRALDPAVIQLDAVVKTIGPVRGSEIGVFVGQSRIGHGNGMVVLQIGTDVFDGNVMRDPAVMTFSATEQIIRPVDFQMQGGIFTAAPAVGPENRHIDAHSAVMTRQAEQAYGTGGADLVIKGITVIQVVLMQGGFETVKTGNAAELRRILAFPVGWNMAVHAR